MRKESENSLVAILLGAKEFPKYEKLDNPAFGRSAEAVLAYFQDDLRLRTEQILNLFDDPSSMIDIDERIANFLINKKGVKDILVFYVGHGGFLRDREYYLVIYSTKKGREHTTGLRIKALAQTLSHHIIDKNLFLILDCCFAGEAVKEFQSMEVAELIETKTFDALPEAGTALLVAASKDEPAISPVDNPFTMFSESFLKVLTEGISGKSAKLSLHEVAVQTQALIKARYGQAAVHPEVHSPRQKGINVASLPMFPNRHLAKAWAADSSRPQGGYRLIRPPLSNVTLAPAIIREMNDRLRKDPCTHAISVATYETALFDELGNFTGIYKTRNTMEFMLTRPTNILQFNFQGGKGSSFSDMKLGCAVRSAIGAREWKSALRGGIRICRRQSVPQLGHPGRDIICDPLAGGRPTNVLGGRFPPGKTQGTHVDIANIPRDKLKDFDYELDEGEELVASQEVALTEFMDRLNLEYPTEKYFIVGRRARNVKQGQSFGMLVESLKGKARPGLEKEARMSKRVRDRKKKSEH